MVKGIRGKGARNARWAILLPLPLSPRKLYERRIIFAREYVFVTPHDEV